MNIIIIPAYNPKDNLKQLIIEIKHKTPNPIVIINDGSKEECDDIFYFAKKQGCHVVDHFSNHGKGASIKTGLNYALETFKEASGFVTCDADGQHLASDILKVSNSLDLHEDALILGVRDFTEKDVPFKSKLGNNISAFYFKHTTKVTVSDTQTGLRGIPVPMLEEALNVEENRYDYEMIFLMNIAKSSCDIVEVPIATIYLNNNEQSHFRPVVDSYRIYKKPVRFAITSLSSALIDIGLFTVLTLFLDQDIALLVFTSTVIARLISGSYNFMLNKLWSFSSKGSYKNEFRKYFILYITQLVLSILFVTSLSSISMNLTFIKVIVDTLLFVGSYILQKNWVFKNKQPIYFN